MTFTNELIYVLLISIIFFSILNILIDDLAGTTFGLSVTIILSILGTILSNIFVIMLAVMIGIAAIASIFINILFHTAN
jgi:hypothetical protein